MKKLGLLVVIIVCFISEQSRATMVVTDPGAYNYLNSLDKKSQDQLGFLQKLQEINLDIKNNTSGNKKVGYGINNRYSLFTDFFLLQDNQRKSDRLPVVTRFLESTYPVVTLKNSDDIEKKKYQQGNIKSLLILSEMMVNNAKQRGVEISSLSTDVDSSSNIKEALDVNNRLLLELLLELRNTNLLLATTARATASRDFGGDILIDGEKEAEVKDLFNGQGDVSNIIRKTTKGGKFTTQTR